MPNFRIRYIIDADNTRAKQAFAEMDRARDRFADKSGSSMGDVFGGTLASQAVSRFTGMLYEGGAAVLDYSAKLEQTKVAFGTLMGGAENARKHLAELRKLSLSSGLEFQTLTKMSQRLQGAGLEAQTLTALLKDIGNVAAATGDMSAERLEGIGVALSQIASKGKVSAEEMEQLSERGVPAWRILSEAIGKTAGETRKLAEDGKISSKEFLAAFSKFSQLNFGTAMEKQAGTFSGAMSKVTNIAQTSAEQAFRPWFERISRFSSDFARELDRQRPAIESESLSIGRLIGTAIGLGIAESEIGQNSFWENTVLPVKAAYNFGKEIARGARSAYQGATDPLNRELSGLEKETQGAIDALARLNREKARLESIKRGEAAPISAPKKTNVVGDAMKRFFEEELGAYVTSDARAVGRKVAGANVVSKHSVRPYEAVDIRTRDRSVQEIFSLTVKAIEKGYRLVDERNKKDQPHQHYEANSRRASAFLSPSMYGGDAQLEYLKKLDQERLGKQTGMGGFEDFVKVDLEEQKRSAEEFMQHAEGILGEWIQEEQRASDERLSIRRVEADQAMVMLDEMLATNELSEREYFERVGLLRIEMLEEEQRELSGQIQTRETQQRLLELSVEIQTERLKKENQIEDSIRRQNREYQEHINNLRKANQRPGTAGGLKQRQMPGEGDGLMDQLYNATGRITSMKDVIGQLGQTASDTFMSMGAGLGAMVESWVMLGDQADVSMKKMLASVLAGVAAQAATLSIFHLAMGIAALTPWGAAAYGPAPLHFKAAALWGAIAVGAALGGRAAAGDSFSGGGKGGGSGSGGSGSNQPERDMTPISKQNENTFISGPNSGTPWAKAAEAIDRLEKKISSMRPGDVLTAGINQKPGTIAQTAVREVERSPALGAKLRRTTGT